MITESASIPVHLDKTPYAFDGNEDCGRCIMKLRVIESKLLPLLICHYEECRTASDAKI